MGLKLKISVVGHTTTGKTRLVKNFMNIPTEDYEPVTICADNYDYTTEVNRKELKIEIVCGKIRHNIHEETNTFTV